jgi:hypothetical protein
VQEQCVPQVQRNWLQRGQHVSAACCRWLLMQGSGERKLNQHGPQARGSLPGEARAEEGARGWARGDCNEVHC